MDCKFDIRLIHEYADNTIGDLEKIFVEEHLKYCSKCNEELIFIKKINNSFRSVLDEIELPDRLSIISELVVENCVSQLNESNVEFKISETFKSYKNTMKTSTVLSKAYENNPYNEFVRKGIDNSFSYLKKPVEVYFMKKLNSIKLFNFIKTG